MKAKVHKKKANMRDVAAYAGVSVATVSRYLNETTGMSDETKSKVRHAIEELKFVPSPAARAINSGRTYIVGALVPTLDHAIFSRFLNALEEELKLAGLSVIVAATDGDPEKELVRAKDLLELGVEGLIVTGAARAGRFLDLTSRYDVPVLATSTYMPDYNFPTVGYNNAASARLAADHLQELGHARVALISGPTTNNDRTSARVASVVAAKFEKLVHQETRFDLSEASNAMRNILTEHSDITAVISTSDVLAQGALHGCLSLGKSIPNEISLVSIDDLPFAKFLAPPLTTVHLPVARMGRAAARNLGIWINSGIEPADLLIESTLVVRGSVSALN